MVNVSEFEEALDRARDEIDRAASDLTASLLGGTRPEDIRNAEDLETARALLTQVRRRAAKRARMAVA